ncbi:MAG: monomethylamine:corrinoid methyltransferase [Syntrophales bacterium]
MGLTLCDILLRSKEGPLVEEKQFDLSIFKKTQELQKKYGICYDPTKPVDVQGDLADRVYQAGRELFLEIGTYCTTTKRSIKLTETELNEEVAACPAEIELGQGKDRVKMVHRSVEGNEEPIVVAGLQTAPFSDEQMMGTIYRLCAEDRCVDGIWGGILLKIDGVHEVIAGTPSEVYQYCKTVSIMRRAIEAAGRPGMVLINNAPTSPATIAMFDETDGLRRSDLIDTTGMSEMKVTYDDLNRSAYGLAHGVQIKGSHSSVMGGFSANPEGASMVSVAATFQLFVIQRAVHARCGTVDPRFKSRVTRGQLWVAGTAIQGLSRNTRLIIDGSTGDHPAAGPGTKQYLYESAAGQVVSTVMGAHATAGTRKYVVGNTCNYGTPLESRWMGEVCKAAIGLERSQALKIVTYLLDKYENNLKDSPAGETFERLYDQKTLQPVPEYMGLYNDVKAELRNLGLKFRD